MAAIEKDFPRGGVKQKAARRQKQESLQDLFKTDEPSSSREKSKKLNHVATAQKLSGSVDRKQKKNKRKLKAKPTVSSRQRTLSSQEESLAPEKLKFRQVEEGMSILSCVSKVGDYSLTMDLPGGLQGEVPITAISDVYTEQLKKLTSGDHEEDEEEVQKLGEMFKPGMILPAKVKAIKVRSGSRKKIILSINPKVVNGELMDVSLQKGLVLSGSIDTIEDHGYTVNLGLQGVKGFLSDKHAEKFVKTFNNGSPLTEGQVVHCCVLSASHGTNRVGKVQTVKVSLKQNDAQITPEMALQNTSLLAGMRVSGTVRKVSKDGLIIRFLQSKGFIHRTHTPEYLHKKAYIKGDQVNAVVLYSLPSNGAIFLSLLPHLTGNMATPLPASVISRVDSKTGHEVTVLDVLKRAVYFRLEDNTLALATLANLGSQGGPSLYKTLKVGSKHMCTGFGYNQIDRTVSIKLQSHVTAAMESDKNSPDAHTKKTKRKTNIDDVSDSVDEPVVKKKKKQKTKESDVTLAVETPGLSTLESSGDIGDNVNQRSVVKKSKQTKSDKDASVLENVKLKRNEKKKTKIDMTEIKYDMTDSKISVILTENEEGKGKRESKKRKKQEKETSDGKKKKKMNEAEESDSGVELNKASDSDEEIKVKPVGSNPPRLSLSVGFSWNEDFSLPPPGGKDDSSDDDSDEEKPVKKSSELRKEKIEEEKKLYEYERQLAEGEQDPVSADDFDRLVLQSPNSSLIWTRYMALHLETVEIDKARAVADRALKTISFREEQEKLNIWVAYLNLENMYGGPAEVKAVLERALQQNDQLKVYTQMVQIYSNTGKMEEAEKMHNTMTKKFGQDKTVWTGFGLFFFKNGRLEAARKLLQRCFKSLDKREHVDMISKFAQLEYKYGEPQRGCTMFENILSNYPKRTDLWSVYIDMVIKTGQLADVRSLFERVIHMKMSSKKMQFFFRKYSDFEKKHGDAKSLDKVKQKAVQYVESQGFAADS